MKKFLRLSAGVQTLFRSISSVKLVYVFGSRAQGKTGSLSDYDFGIYLSEKDAKKRMAVRITLISKLCKFLQTDAIDVTILNDTRSPELKYHVIKDGFLIYQQEPYKVLIEPKILNEYFDFIDLLRLHGLTKA